MIIPTTDGHDDDDDDEMTNMWCDCLKGGTKMFIWDERSK